MPDPVQDIIGDYRAFVAQQRDRLRTRGIEIAGYEFSHLAFRVPEWDQYVHVRTLLERHSTANVEGIWNGRPMSMLLLTDALRVRCRARRVLARSSPAIESCHVGLFRKPRRVTCRGRLHRLPGGLKPRGAH
jgi:predicted metalloenzyme YecM